MHIQKIKKSLINFLSFLKNTVFLKKNFEPLKKKLLELYRRGKKFFIILNKENFTPKMTNYFFFPSLPKFKSLPRKIAVALLSQKSGVIFLSLSCLSRFQSLK